MVLISSQSSSIWSSGYNGVITILNNTVPSINYLSNWSILCTLPEKSTITWSDSLDISSINSYNQVILKPRSYVQSLASGVNLSIAYGGTGSIPVLYKFISNTKPPSPTGPIDPIQTPTLMHCVNNQKRVVYLGYWFSDGDISKIISDLKTANITHVLLTFILQPDYTKPLTGAGTMLDAFKFLSLSNQKLLTSSFKVGISLGGALQIPVPYSNTFSLFNAYYYNNPQKYAQDYYNLVKGTGLDNYFDLDIEGINDKFIECSDFIGNICKELKRLNPICEISHAPQMPYFWSSFGNVYDIIYKNYKQYFDFFNMQFYNNGPSNNFDQIFIKSDQNVAPQTSVLELINRGYNPSYLVVGKTVADESNTNNGYIPLPELTTIVKQAFQTPILNQWCKSGGTMIWYYNTGNLNSDNNKQLLNYFKTTSQF